MTGQLSSPDENYDRRHDLYHRRATFRNSRELDLTNLPVLIRYGAALFFSAFSLCAGQSYAMSLAAALDSCLSGSLEPRNNPAETLSPSYRNAPVVQVIASGKDPVRERRRIYVSGTRASVAEPASPAQAGRIAATL